MPYRRYYGLIVGILTESQIDEPVLDAREHVLRLALVLSQYYGGYAHAGKLIYGTSLARYGKIHLAHK